MNAYQELKLKYKLENVFQKNGYECCSVKEVKTRKNFTFLICNESNDFGNEEFIIEYKNGKFLNADGEDLEEIK